MKKYSILPILMMGVSSMVMGSPVPNKNNKKEQVIQDNSSKSFDKEIYIEDFNQEVNVSFINLQVSPQITFEIFEPNYDDVQAQEIDIQEFLGDQEREQLVPVCMTMLFDIYDVEKKDEHLWQDHFEKFSKRILKNDEIFEYCKAYEKRKKAFDDKGETIDWDFVKKTCYRNISLVCDSLLNKSSDVIGSGLIAGLGLSSLIKIDTKAVINSVFKYSSPKEKETKELLSFNNKYEEMFSFRNIFTAVTVAGFVYIGFAKSVKLARVLYETIRMAYAKRYHIADNLVIGSSDANAINRKSIIKIIENVYNHVKIYKRPSIDGRKSL